MLATQWMIEEWAELSEALWLDLVVYGCCCVHTDVHGTRRRVAPDEVWYLDGEDDVKDNL